MADLPDRKPKALTVAGLIEHAKKIGYMSTADTRVALKMIDSFVDLDIQSGNTGEEQQIKGINMMAGVIRERCAREDAQAALLKDTQDKVDKLTEALATSKQREKTAGEEAERSREDLHRSRFWVMVLIALLTLLCGIALVGGVRYQVSVSTQAPPPPPPPQLLELLVPLPPTPPEPPLPIYPLLSTLPLMERCFKLSFPVPSILSGEVIYDALAYALHHHQDKEVSPVCSIHVGLPYCFCVARENVGSPHIEMFNPRLVGYSIGQDGLAMVQESYIACPRMAWMMRFRVVWIRYEDRNGLTAERRFDRHLAYEMQHLLELLDGDTSCGTERLSTISRLMRDGHDQDNIRWLSAPPPALINGREGDEVKAIGS